MEGLSVPSLGQLNMAFTLANALVACYELELSSQDTQWKFDDLAEFLSVHLGDAAEFYVDETILGHALIYFWDILSAKIKPSRIIYLRGFEWTKVKDTKPSRVLVPDDVVTGLKCELEYGHIYKIGPCNKPSYTLLDDNLMQYRMQQIIELAEKILHSKKLLRPDGCTSINSVFHPKVVKELIHAKVQQHSKALDTIQVGSKRSSDNISSSSSSSSQLRSQAYVHSYKHSQQQQQPVQSQQSQLLPTSTTSPVDPIKFVRDKCIEEIKTLGAKMYERYKSYDALIKDGEKVTDLATLMREAIRFDLPYVQTTFSIFFEGALSNTITAEVKRRFQNNISLHEFYVGATCLPLHFVESMNKDDHTPKELADRVNAAVGHAHWLIIVLMNMRRQGHVVSPMIYVNSLMAKNSTMSRGGINYLHGFFCHDVKYIH